MPAAASAPAKKAPKKPAAHPMYKEMIAAAIKALANKSGSSKQAISKYISANYKVGDRHEVHLKSALLRGIAGGALVKKSGTGCSGSFKLAKPVAAPKKKVAPKKKPAAPKKKKATTPKKKVAPKKKAATPKKKAAAPKKKATPKKKAAPKKKPAAKKAAPKKATPKKASK